VQQGSPATGTVLRCAALCRTAACIARPTAPRSMEEQQINVPKPPDVAPDALVPPADLALGPPNARAAVTHEPLARGRLQSRRFLETKERSSRTRPAHPDRHPPHNGLRQIVKCWVGKQSATRQYCHWHCAALCSFVLHCDVHCTIHGTAEYGGTSIYCVCAKCQNTSLRRSRRPRKRFLSCRRTRRSRG
jgi:hypothetical protein